MQIVAGRQPVRHCSKHRSFSGFFLPLLEVPSVTLSPVKFQTTCGLLPFGPGNVVDGLSPRVRCVVATRNLCCCKSKFSSVFAIRCWPCCWCQVFLSIYAISLLL